MLFDFLKKNSISIGQGLEDREKDASIALIDVREKDEFKAGHLPHAVNMPLSTFPRDVEKKLKDKNQKIYLYCRSGSRSGRATQYMKKIGYTDVTNIGGIISYRGTLVK